MSKAIAIIGGGLAATACAYSLKNDAGQHSVTPVIFEAGERLATGASGNIQGIYDPRFQKLRNGVGDYFFAAFKLAFQIFSGIQERTDIGFDPCGTLYLIKSEDERAYYQAMIENQRLSGDDVRIVSAQEASAVSRITLRHDALFLPHSGFVSPALLCAAQARDIDVRLSAPVRNLEQRGSGWRVNGEPFDSVIIACGFAARYFSGCEWLPLQNVRGQMIVCPANGNSANLACNINYGGHISKPVDGLHVIGSTFQQNDTDLSLRESDNERILARLKENLPSIAEGMKASRAAAALRTASKDRVAITGLVPRKGEWTTQKPVFYDNLYLSTAHGSYGIISSLASARMISDQILGHAPHFSEETRKAVAPDRFLYRLERKGRI
ncbi:MAG: FAD-dependent 5-carboxymethylaminomethyl-2-thiouridine(34) oxidoreductase MnmC [Micavibrio aeruginosavorus]|uniref:FAD-dependent 5-carboxymethylaminomethyl-2-thiouridine(34) oxidoreductase MnmC n=1 Tax=Micavibrio aeruginosavorus TaxID=349221 RepID=A0A7T5UGZ4_9BACT|nr:MAG: FAD-dependent 5-carboxymethylaminomethyl-2-thiouridine(34) oxidoreductase MnmC [Micavibrio aeruginosavorus]